MHNRQRVLHMELQRRYALYWWLLHQRILCCARNMQYLPANCTDVRKRQYAADIFGWMRRWFVQFTGVLY